MLMRMLTADISPTAKLLAAALYASSPDGGAAPAAEILSLVGIRTPGALRHLRTELADAQIVSTWLAAGQLNWQWIGAAQPAAARPTDARVPQTRTAAETARPTDARVPQTRTTDPVTLVTPAERVPQTRTAVRSASQPRAARPTDAHVEPVTPVTPAPARPTDAQFPPHTPPVGRLLINTINSQTNLPTPLPPARTDEAEPARALRLLRAVGVQNGAADDAVSRLSLRQIATKVAEYLADRADGSVRGAGVLKSRLAADAPDTWLPLNDPAWTHPLLAQHIAADLAAWRTAEAADQRSRYRTAAAPTAQTLPAPAADDLAAPLAAFRAAVTARIPKITITAEAQDGRIIVVLPPGAADRRITVANLAARHLPGDVVIIEAT